MCSVFTSFVMCVLVLMRRMCAFAFFGMIVMIICLVQTFVIVFVRALMLMGGWVYR